MKRINNSNFELLQDIIKEIDFDSNIKSAENLEQLKKYWKQFAGEKISKLSMVYDFSADGLLTIVCSDAFTANELYFAKEKLLGYMNEKVKNLGITIKDIKFDYRKWKENSYE